MSKSCDFTSLGLLHYCLGVEVQQTGTNIFISQTKYARSVLDMFKMTNCKILSTSMEKTNSKVVNESIYKQLLGDRYT
jgi:hypothetical protein